MARKLSIQAVNELDFARLPFAPRRRFHPLRVSSLRSVGLLTVCQTTKKRESCTVIRIYLIVGNLFSSESEREQTEAGIISLGAEEIKLLKSYTRLYKEKFGFPLVICALLNNKATILERIRERLNNDSYQELNIGIKEVKDIMVLRVKDLVNSETSKI